MFGNNVKTFLKVVLVLLGGCMWMLLLCLAEHLPQPKGFQGFSTPTGEILAVAVSLGPPFAACMIVLQRSLRPYRLHAGVRWTGYSILSAVIAVASLFGGNAFTMALGLQLSGPRAPGPGDFTEQDVQNFVKPGQLVEEVTNRFGVPNYTKTNQFNQVVMHFFSGLPDTYGAKTIVIAGEPGYVFAGFDLWSTNGKVMRWRVSDWEKTGR
jgi:hypothetical protein